jgi:hypothetical protein
VSSAAAIAATVDVSMSRTSRAAASAAVPRVARMPALEWARSGLMALSGPPSGPPIVPGFDLPGAIETLLADLSAAASLAGRPRPADLRWLTERAQLLALKRGGQVSCNGSCRLLEARDGWIAVNLPRSSDIGLLPAWLGASINFLDWRAIARHVRQRDTADLLTASEGLGLAVAVATLPATRARPIGMPAGPASPDASAQPSLAHPSFTPAARCSDPPLVVDLSALWAGPLCGHLLQQAGARVIKVESAGRPDSIRHACPALFDRLHAGKQSVVLDFTDASQRRQLRELLVRADLVISSARPRAFEQLGLDPHEWARDARPRAWIAITAHGWQGVQGQRVGFGDDVAAGAGLLATVSDGRPVFLGDAIADPLTGIAAATRALQALGSGANGVIDVSLHATALRVARAPHIALAERGKVALHGGRWQLRVRDQVAGVAPPMARPCGRRAVAFGADTRTILKEFT